GREGFELGRAPLLRARLLRVGEGEHVLALALHHIISDGWSMGVLVGELAEAYEAAGRGEGGRPTELPIQYADFTHWQREFEQTEEYARQLDYWLRQLAGAPALLELPTDRPRPAVLGTRGARRQLALGAETLERLRSWGRAQGVSMYMLLLSALACLLRRQTGQEDLVIGSPVANRSWREVEGLIGLFANTLALRLRVGGDEQIQDVLRGVRQVVLEAQEHDAVRFEQIVERLQPERSLGWSPVFQVMFTYQEAILEERRLEDLALIPLEVESNQTAFDLTLTAVEQRGGLTISAEYSTELFEAPTIDRLLAHYARVLEALLDDAAQKVSELSLLTPEEEHQLVVEWNAGRLALPPGRRVHELIQEQARRTPDALAVMAGTQRLTYGELETRSERLARQLRSLGVGPEVRVGLGFERSIDYVVALLGVFKAGGAAVPLDPANPEWRLLHMIRDASVSTVVTREELLKEVPAYSQAERAVCLSPTRPSFDENGGPPHAGPVDGRNIAYVLYTSGSTGRPKGVAVSHDALLNHCYAARDEYGLGAQDRVLQFASVSFDVSLEEILPTLLSGATLVLRTGDGWSPPEFAKRLSEYRLTVVNLPAAFWQQLVRERSFAEAAEAGGGPRLWVVGSEVVSPEGVRAWASTPFASARLVNAYGTTETTITSTLYEIRAGEDADGGRIPLGRPTPNVTAYILDEKGAVVPVGVRGELHVGGEGVARGYLNRPGLTAEKFIPDRFSTSPGARLYRTGDLARYRPDGNIEFMGRADDQVKIRGFRVEPAEVAAVVREHGAVRDCFVTVEEGGAGDGHLTAYVVAGERPPGLASELRAHCRERLPAYMRPSAFVLLEALPLNSSGKVDRRALPKSGYADRSEAGSYKAPGSHVEELLAGIWADVLGLARVGIHDDFFELGGHSLLVTHMISKVREVLKVELPVRKVFQLHTVAELAAWLAAGEAETVVSAPPITKVPREQDLPLSFAQQRLWFYHQLAPESPAYNMPVAVRLEGRLDLPALARTLGELVRRHETLRTTFRVRNRRPVQLVGEPREVPLAVEDLSMLDAGERAARVEQLAAEEAAAPFDLEQGPLLRVRLLRLGGEEHVALMTTHHIVSDGWSMALLTNEVGQLYRAFLNDEAPNLPDLPVQYADYAHWQREWLQGDQLEKHLAYWKRHLSGAFPVRELPTDRPRPAAPDFTGEYRRYVLPAELERAIRGLSREEGATIFMTLLAVFDVLLARYTGSTDVVVGSAVAGRNRAEVENLIGFFVNMLVLRVDLAGDPKFRELLARAKEASLGAYAHQELPFDLLVDELRPERDPGRSPLFQVAFGVQNQRQQSLELPGLTLSPYPFRYEAVRYDLTVWVSEEADGLAVQWAFRSDLFDAETVERMHAHYVSLLRSVAADPDARIADLEMLTEAEKEQLRAAASREAEEMQKGFAVRRRSPVAVSPEGERL
ncbi:MAG TPA: amino acid adenylation domain-containing protein, partial [Pyrinomonadaceae bacterium]|nr:amino acid adenylation domain-containing protein [Pyrinomonadaceae bacterium]